MRLELSKSVIRPFSTGDAAAIAKHWNNRNLWINLNDSFPHPFTMESADTFLNDASSAPESWLAIEVDGEAAGAFHLTIQPRPKHHSVAIGYWLSEEHWNKGIVTEALSAVTEHIFSVHKLSRAFAFVFEGNTASMRLLEKCGYRREGWLHRSVIKNGKAIDQALYAKLRPENRGAMDRVSLAKRIYAAANIRGQFRLRSGQLSDEYFDKYLFESQPELLRAIAEQMAALTPPGVDALAGLEMGGIPVATVLSQVTGVPALFVRKAPKEYGTCKLAEGGQVAGRRLLIIEDVVTSGGQVITSARQLRERGAMVTDVLCVIDRESGGFTNLQQNGLRLQALFTASEVKSLAT